MKSETLLSKGFSGLLMLAIVSNTFAVTAFAKTQVGLTNRLHSEKNKDLQNMQTLIQQIKELHATHIGTDEATLQSEYYTKFTRALSTLNKRLADDSLDEKVVKRIQKTIEKIEDERADISHKSKNSILQREVKEIKYLEKKFKAGDNSQTYNGITEMFEIMFGFVFCCTIVLLPIGMALIEHAEHPWKDFGDF